MPRNDSVGPMWLPSAVVVDHVQDHLDAGLVHDCTNVLTSPSELLPRYSGCGAKKPMLL